MDKPKRKLVIGIIGGEQHAQVKKTIKQIIIEMQQNNNRVKNELKSN